MSDLPRAPPGFWERSDAVESGGSRGWRSHTSTAIIAERSCRSSAARSQAVLREALRRLLRLPMEASISPGALQLLRRELGIVVLDASRLHPVTADRRTQDTLESRPPEAVCTHHFVSSWVAHSRATHADTERRRARPTREPNAQIHVTRDTLPDCDSAHGRRHSAGRDCLAVATGPQLPMSLCSPLPAHHALFSFDMMDDACPIPSWSVLLVVTDAIHWAFPIVSALSGACALSGFVVVALVMVLLSVMALAAVQQRLARIEAMADRLSAEESVTLQRASQ